MNYQQIYQEVIDLRFNNLTLKVGQVKKWVGQAEAWVWNQADWDFKRQPLTSLSVSGGLGTLPTDFGKAKRLIDPRGLPVDYLPPDLFEELYRAPVPLPVGNAEAFTVMPSANGARALQVGPKETGNFQLSYRRRYTHLNNAGLPIVGFMANDTDTPVWDSEFHYLLVPAAVILGQKLEFDPTAEYLRSQRDELLAGMKDEHIGGVENNVRVWGEDGSSMGGGFF